MREPLYLIEKSLGNRFNGSFYERYEDDSLTLYISIKSDDPNSTESTGKIEFLNIEIKEQPEGSGFGYGRGFGNIAGIIIYEADEFNFYEIMDLGGLDANMMSFKPSKTFKIYTSPVIPDDSYRKTKEHSMVLEMMGRPESESEKKMKYNHVPYRIYEMGNDDENDTYFTYLISKISEIDSNNRLKPEG